MKNVQSDKAESARTTILFYIKLLKKKILDGTYTYHFFLLKCYLKYGVHKQTNTSIFIGLLQLILESGMLILI